MSEVYRVAWYRFRTSLTRRWRGYLSVVLLIGLVGGLALASLAGARRTESSFHEFLESTNPSDLSLVTGLFHPDPTGYDRHLVREIARLPYVTRIESEVGYEAEEVGPTGRPVQSAITSGLKQVGLYSSVDGLFFKMDRLVVLSGRMPNPARANEVAVTPDAARLLHVHLGSQLAIGVVGNVQSLSNCETCVPRIRETFTVVGIVISRDEVAVVPVQRPAEVADAGTLRAIPTSLAFTLFVGALIALGLTLVSSVNRRRRDLALLKALGFTQRQLASAVAWQATIAAIVGLVVGLPVGAIIGRELWSAFARSISVVPEPTVPIVALVLVAVGALFFANAVALLPGRRAARISAALIFAIE